MQGMHTAARARLQTLARMQYEREEVWFPCSQDILAWDEDFHALMLQDELRMSAYHAAINETVAEGMTVLDLGTGTGILAKWALDAGAAKVYGIDVNRTVLDQARVRLEQAGYHGRFELHAGLSYDIELPTRTDIIVSEIMGNLGDNEDCPRILADAHRRFLRPGGLMLPAGMTTYLVPVAAARAHQHVIQSRVRTLNARYDIETLASRLGIDSLFNLYYDAILPRSTYLAGPAMLRRFDFSTERAETDYDVTLRYEIERAGAFTGFKGYFIAPLGSGVVLDISDDDIERRTTSDSWKHCYLPVAAPVAVAPGDVIEVQFSRSSVGNHGSPFSHAYRWRGRVTRTDRIINAFDHGPGSGD